MEDWYSLTQQIARWYDNWMQNANYYLGKYGWTKVEQ